MHLGRALTEGNTSHLPAGDKWSSCQADSGRAATHGSQYSKFIQFMNMYIERYDSLCLWLLLKVSAKTMSWFGNTTQKVCVCSSFSFSCWVSWTPAAAHIYGGSLDWLTVCSQFFTLWLFNPKKSVWATSLCPLTLIMFVNRQYLKKEWVNVFIKNQKTKKR